MALCDKLDTIKLIEDLPNEQYPRLPDVEVPTYALSIYMDVKENRFDANMSFLSNIFLRNTSPNAFNKKNEMPLELSSNDPSYEGNTKVVETIRGYVIGASLAKEMLDDEKVGFQKLNEIIATPPSFNKEMDFTKCDMNKNMYHHFAPYQKTNERKVTK